MSEGFSLRDAIDSAAPDLSEPYSFLPLARRLLPTITGRAARLSKGDPSLKEELEVAGVLGVYEALAKFDPSRGVPLPNFANAYAMNRISDELRSRRGPHAHFENLFVASLKRAAGCPQSLEALQPSFFSPPECDESASDPMNTIIEQERRDAVRRFIETLPARLRGIGRAHFVRGLRQAEVAREFRLSRTAVSKCVKAIIRLASDCSALLVYGKPA